MRVATGVKRVERLRRRPSKALTSKRPFEEAFGNKRVALLGIPELIDDYNHYKSEVDKFDQLRSYYSTQQVKRRTWRPLLYFLLDVVVNNCYRLSSYSTPERAKRSGHKDFIYRLFEQLIQGSARPAQGRTKRPKLDKVTAVDESSHGDPVKMFAEAKTCSACAESGRKSSQGQPLQARSVNIQQRQQRCQRPPRTLYGCQLCQLPLCRPTQRPECWREHIRRAETIQKLNTNTSKSIK